jgi:hypothetical protein
MGDEDRRMGNETLVALRSLIFGLVLAAIAAMCAAAVSSESVAADRPDHSPGKSLTNAETERILRKGRIVRSERIGVGVTNPLKLWLELDGLTFTAAFKDLDYRRRGVTRFQQGGAELNFTDSYLYERAAYLLDRHLGIEMVPPAVLRKVKGNDGCVVAWIEGAFNDRERRERDLRPPDLRLLADQRATMRVFDALIYNTDRNPGNQLYTPEDWKLHLIDHTRAFRRTKQLPSDFAARPVSLSRGLFDRLGGLDETELGQLLGDVLGPGQIEALLRRQRLILEKIERDRLTYGDDFVFREEANRRPR